VRRPNWLYLKPFREMEPVPIGVVFLSLMAVLLLLSFNIDKLPFTSGHAYSAAFMRAEGLRKGDRVMVGGVVVGKVTSVGLEGTHVRIGFNITSGGVHLGMQSTASIQIATLLGNKYLSLTPAGPGSWPGSRELPLTQTRQPFDIEPAFQGLATTVGAIDTKQLATALDTLATTFKDSPLAVRSMLGGLSRLSQTIASRDGQLTELLKRADVLTGVLAQRRQDFTKIFGAGDQLLVMLQQRRAVIDSLLANTSAMAQQLTGLVHDNQATLKPALQQLHDVLAILNAHQDNLDQIVKELYVFLRGEVDATGSGPWFDGTAINATNPIQVGGASPKVSAARPRTLGDLLGVGAAQRAVAQGGRGR
jgi:phospholipid/cholesterol/gamma-HCH transport system substrate-binding protein